MSLLATNTKITYDTVCPLTDKPIHREVEPSNCSYEVLTSFYDDIDDGQKVSENFTCPHCNSCHEVTIHKDDGGGFCS